jgi:hypothetical protein
MPSVIMLNTNALLFQSVSILLSVAMLSVVKADVVLQRVVAPMLITLSYYLQQAGRECGDWVGLVWLPRHVPCR